MCSRRLQPGAGKGVSSVQDVGRVPGDSRSGVSSVQGCWSFGQHSYGESVRESAAERHDRRVEAIEMVLRNWHVGQNGESLRRMARECLDAVEAGF